MKIPSVRSSLWIVAILLLNCLRAGAAEAHWLTDYSQALDQSKTEKRNILLDFTGSDWCPVCDQMDKEVLNTQEFIDYANKNLILVRLDFPVSKPLPRKLQDQNDLLQQRYGVEGFPSFILIDKTGKVLVANVGYVPGGPAGFIDMLNGTSPKDLPAAPHQASTSWLSSWFSHVKAAL